MVGNDSSLLGGIVAAMSLMVTNLIITRLISKNKFSKDFFGGEPQLLSTKRSCDKNRLWLTKVYPKTT